ncbi:DUF6417 family protein [Streptomyces sp. NPDC050743]|uniref:DUF6417 family protein n=1 Tax=Streptomyces sp. NPDC050743 TaxID=3365634 RepID=UPI0037A4CD80
MLSGDLRPNHQQGVESVAAQGLAELADREMRAELSAHEGRPILWAARLTPQGHDVLAYTDASPAPVVQLQGLVDGEQLIELRPAEMDALRVYMSVEARLRVPQAEGLAERVRTACFDRPGNRWQLCLTAEQIESVAYAFYLRSMGGSVAEANRFGREYGVVFHADRLTGSLRLICLR